MSRTYQSNVDSSIQVWLDQLIDESTDTTHYREAMYHLGLKQGELLSEEMKGKSVAVACTVEDADFLAKGVLEAISRNAKSVSLACFWNKRFSGNEVFQSTAPIVRKYKEPQLRAADTLVIVKSIISGSCVVKTNLMHLIHEMSPTRIFVLAPVMHSQAPNKLSQEFPNSIASKFSYCYFAKDDKRTEDGEVIPGIGGSVYERLGFDGQEKKNRYTPDLVRARRQMLAV